MLYNYETEYGSIGVTKNVIRKIIVEAVAQFGGKVTISNHKGKLANIASKISGADELSYIEISTGTKGVNVKIYVVIRFGTSISTVTNQLIETIQKNVKEFVDIELNSVSVVVAGVISKNIVRRYIEVKR